jgi:hypothetical protein
VSSERSVLSLPFQIPHNDLFARSAPARSQKAGPGAEIDRVHLTYLARILRYRA